MSTREKRSPEPTPRDALDDDRAAILARRSAFVAAALATLTAAVACEPAKDGQVPSLEAPPARPLPENRPEPCLTARPVDEPDAAPSPEVVPPDAGRAAEPVPCLSVAPTAVPAPCLSPKPPPHPCLSVRKPPHP
ncbi:MAG: hypothetical protein U0183_09730 [Polyangiaceae bacterium]